VAEQTVNARQANRVKQMIQNKPRSTLDLSFADVNLSQSKLLQLDAQRNLAASMATLDAVLGLDREVTYQLVDDATQDNGRHPISKTLIQTA
jgi:outer membrane protein